MKRLGEEKVRFVKYISACLLIFTLLLVFVHANSISPLIAKDKEENVVSLDQSELLTPRFTPPITSDWRGPIVSVSAQNLGTKEEPISEKSGSIFSFHFRTELNQQQIHKGDVFQIQVSSEAYDFSTVKYSEDGSADPYFTLVVQADQNKISLVANKDVNLQMSDDVVKTIAINGKKNPTNKGVREYPIHSYYYSKTSASPLPLMDEGTKIFVQNNQGFLNSSLTSIFSAGPQWAIKPSFDQYFDNFVMKISEKDNSGSFRYNQNAVYFSGVASNMSKIAYDNTVLHVRTNGFLIDQSSLVQVQDVDGGGAKNPLYNFEWDSDGQGFTVKIGRINPWTFGTAGNSFFVKTNSMQDEVKLTTWITGTEVTTGNDVEVDAQTTTASFVKESDGKLQPFMRADEIPIIYTNDPPRGVDYFKQFIHAFDGSWSNPIPPEKITVDLGDFDQSKVNLMGYTIYYSATNKNGITATLGQKVFVYEPPKAAGVTVRYRDVNNKNVKVHDDTLVEGRVNDPYKVTPLDVPGWELVPDQTIGNVEGKFTAGPINVTFMYKRLLTDVTIKFVDKNGNQLLNYAPIVLSKEIGKPIDLTKEAKVQDVVNAIKQKHYDLLPLGFDEKNVMINEGSNELIYKFDRSFTDVTVNFTDPTGKPLLNYQPVVISAQIDSVLDLSQNQQVQTIVNEIKQKHYDLLPLEFDEKNVIVKEEGNALSYKFDRSNANVTVKFVDVDGNQLLNYEPIVFSFQIGWIIDLSQNQQVQAVVNEIKSKHYDLMPLKFDEKKVEVNENGNELIYQFKRSDTKVTVKFEDAKGNQLLSYEPIVFSAQIDSVIDMTKNKEVQTIVDEIKQKHYELMPLSFDETNVKVLESGNELVYKFERSFSNVTIRFVDMSGNQLLDYGPIVLNEQIDTVLDLTKNQQIQKIVNEIKEKHYNLLPLKFDEKKVVVKETGNELIYQFDRADTKVTIQFVDTLGKQLLEYKPIVLTAKIGTILDLTKNEDVQDRVSEIKQNYFTLQSLNFDEKKVEVKETGNVFSYIFEGTLSLVSAPKVINFGEVTYNAVKKVESPVNIDSSLIVQDSRIQNKSQWELRATVKKMMTGQSGNQLPKSLHYISGNDDIVLNSQGSIVYQEKSKNNGQFNISDSWTGSENNGLKFVLESNDNPRAESYSGEIMWQILPGSP